jgi:hypothetical protein
VRKAKTIANIGDGFFMSGRDKKGAKLAPHSDIASRI